MSNDYYAEQCKNYINIPTVLSKAHRVVAIGDIHGDYDLCIKMLKLAKVIDDDLNWIGGDTIIVQVGDQIDRCRPTPHSSCETKNGTLDDEHSDIKILILMIELDKKAQKAFPPGKVISLLGNHELMNVQGFMNYVSHKGINEFNNYSDPHNPDMEFDNGLHARKHAFSPGNQYATLLGCTRIGSVIIGSNLFVHAGIIEHFLTETNINSRDDLKELNTNIQKWLLGVIERDKIDNVVGGSDTSMFWNRILGSLPKNVSMKDPRCYKNIAKVLKILKIKSMIIGHTPQSFKSDDFMNATCGGKVWRIDNGSSKAFHGFDEKYQKTGIVDKNRQPQVLEILNDNEYNVIM